jgi:hypothetical protein
MTSSTERIMIDSQITAPLLAPMSGSERVRRTRERQGKDILLISVEVLPNERDKLIKLGLLHKSKRGSKVEVRDAIYAFLDKNLDPPPVWPVGSWTSGNGANNV